MTDLNPSQFHIFDDGEEQVLKSCSSEDVPISIGLFLDRSGSMGARLGLMKAAAIRIVRAANPSDEYFLVEFQTRAQVVQPFTYDTAQLLQVN